MKKSYASYLLCILLLCLYSSFAKANNQYIVNFDRNTYGAANKNWSIDQDERGCTYFGNDIGLLQFNGVEWKLFQMANRSVVRSVAVLDHQTIFTGGYEEFGLWKRDISGQLKYTSLKSLVDQKSMQENDFWKIWFNDNKVYFQSFNSIFIYDYKTVKQIKINKNILFLLKVRGQFWVQEMQGELFRLIDDKLTKINDGAFFTGKDVRTILPYKKDQYLICTATNGFYIYDGVKISPWNTPISSALKLNELNCGLLTSRGTYFFGSILNGIYEVDENGNILNHFSTATELNNNTVLSLREDKNGNFWAGLDRGIAYIQYLDNMSYYTDPNGNIGAVYDAFYWKNKLYIGTNQGLFYMPEGKLQSVNSLENLRLVNGTQGQVWSLRVIDNKLICCHNRGAMIIENDKSYPYLPFIMSGIYDIKEYTVNKAEILAVSTYNHLKIVHKGTNKVYDIDDSRGPVFKSELDHLGNIWVQHPYKGTYRYLFNEDVMGVKNWSYYGDNTQENLPHKLSMFKVGGRIILFGDNNFLTYDEIDNTIKPNEKLNNCFKSINKIKKIIHIKDNSFWAITDKSLFKFSYDGSEAKIEERYNIGVHKLSLVEGYENISILNDSINFICLDNGFLLYNDKIPAKKYKSVQDRPYLETLEIKSTKGKFDFRDPATLSEVPYEYNSVTFSFISDQVLSRNLLFQYKLVGIDNEWSKPQKIDKVTYDRLSAGKYTFMLRTTDNIGYTSEITTSQFVVLSPWYLSLWAYLIYILLIMFVAYIVWVIILRRYKNKHLQKIRQREAERLQTINQELQSEIEKKDAEIFDQTSFTIQKNEIILSIKEVIDEFCLSSDNKTLKLLYQKVLPILNNNLEDDNDWKILLIKFEQKHTNFFKKLKILYPELTPNDLKLCACLKLNLETKDIASLMNLSTRSVENNRYRLRKKLNLRSTQNLNDFILNLD